MERLRLHSVCASVLLKYTIWQHLRVLYVSTDPDIAQASNVSAGNGEQCLLGDIPCLRRVSNVVQDVAERTSHDATSSMDQKSTSWVYTLSAWHALQHVTYSAPNNPVVR